jgi:molecular chaperone GrpE
MAQDREPFEIPVGDAADEPNALLTRVAELEQRLATAEEVAAREKLELLRKAADLDNARKRMARDYERACATASRALVAKLLPLLNDLHRAAAEAAADAAVPAHVVEALQTLAKRVSEALRAEGLEPVPCAPGDPFDPTLHEAVMVRCTPELPPQTVAAVLEPGYMFQGMLLRPTKVEVCVAPAEAAEDGA